jgi:hypothetical protein
VTVSSTTNRVSYTGNGSTTAFAFSHPFRLTSDLVVTVRTTATGAESLKVEGSDYTVSGTADSGTGGYSSGTVTFTTAPASGTQVHIDRVVTRTQTSDFISGDGIPPASIEGALDKLSLALQELDSRFGRTLLQPRTAANRDLVLPEPTTARAGQLLGVNGSGNAYSLRTVTGFGGFPSAADYGAVGDGVATDTTAYTDLFTAFQSAGGGIAALLPKSITTHTNEENDNVKALTLNNSRAGLMRVQVGTKSAPIADSLNPALVVQKFTKYDADGAPNSHQVGGLFSEIYLKGSGVSGSNDVEGTWIGLAGNAHQESQNFGTSSSQDWDAIGNVIGVAGFASAEGVPGSNKIVTALWGYASTPNVDQATVTNAPGAFVTCALELNVNMRHPDQGAQTIVAQRGDTIGAFIYNYRDQGAGVRNWTFGIAFSGTPDDGNFSSTDPSNWSGFHTGILLDKIKSSGILFGQYFQNTAYGLKFPTAYGSSAMRPAAAMFLGDNQINMATDFAGTKNNGDFWQSGGFLGFKYGGVEERILTERSAALRFASTTTLDFQVNSLTTLRLGTVASAVNRFTMFPAATGGAPALVAAGTDANIGMEFRSTGTGRQFHTINGAEQFEITSTASAVNKISVTGAATGAAPVISASGSDSNIDVKITPKGTGAVQFGTHTGTADTAISGYITIKDAGGTTRKLAVIT